MVDAGHQVVELRRRDPEHAAELRGGVLNGVAQPDGADRAGFGDGPAQHRHRVDVLEEQGVRAELLHVAADVEQHRDRPQAAHDPADSERVGDRLTDPVALGDDEVDHRRRMQAADLKAGDDVVRAVERDAPVGGRLHAGACPADLGDPASHHLRGLKALGIDVHQRQRGPVRECGKAQQIADQVARENRRARTDDRDLRGHRP